MSNSNHKPTFVGTIRTLPSDLTKDQGHSYGAGRQAEPHADRRTKRSRTRADKRRDALRGW